MTYAFDGFTNTGVTGSLQATKNLMAQVGIFAGMDSSLWKSRRTMIPAIPGGQLYTPAPGVFAMTSAQAPYLGPEDPGIRPSLSGCLRYQTDDAADNLYLCANTINNGTYGYNNLQWYGGTF